ncbi:hypothetical protein DLAC_05028 [Tieghemostelium lacteum]|uniref:DUF7949 domain-containing protein n=1 Tax=Tieghemostelium lacteum TaxID=361077 RepID=A0A151ZIA5_TIELA|nr:hypothetical protein DLAC_05028 [Tieghemostelium lacteum]|eukprot:KYQ93645.1 hypothetical protein DLAC_05028 [Tieghemostelium lacteum]
MIKIITLFILLFLFKLSESLLSSQYNALQNIDTVLNQGWDLTPATICTQTQFVCDSSGDYIAKVYLIDPSSSIPLPTTELFQFINLKELGIGLNIPFGIDFWNGLATNLNNLTRLSISILSESLPNNVGNLLPASLTYLIIERSTFPFPETLFTKSSLISLNLGSLNTVDDNLFPSSISEPSNLYTLDVRNTGSFSMAGTNFTNIFQLSIYHSGSTNPMSYDIYNTWSVKYLQIEYENIVPMSMFPQSIYSMPNLLSLKVFSNDRVLLTGSNQVLNFTSNPNFFSLSLDKFNILPDLVYPGILFSPNVSVNSVSVSSSVFNFSAIDYFKFSTIEISKSTFIGVPIDSDYSTMNSFRIFDSPSFTGPLLDSMCRIKTDMYILNTSISSLPSCFLCEWGNPDIQSKFNFNPNLPVYSYQCPNFDMTSYQTQISTRGGYLEISGIDLGWFLYDQNNNKFSDNLYKVIIGNQVIGLKVNIGTGAGQMSTQVKFHSVSNPTGPVFTLNYSYMPPSVSSLQPSSTELTLLGTNFYNNVSKIEAWVAGKPMDIANANFEFIRSKSGCIPYDKNLTVSIKVTVDGQSVYNVFRAPGFDPKLFTPFPKLYSGGGIIEIPGQYLTFDTTIMNFTINGILFSDNITQSNSDKYLFGYAPISKGIYPYEFNLLEYQQSGTIEVTDEMPCVVVAGNGYCQWQTPVCYNPWTGPDCGSLPANLTIPSMPSVNPNIVSSTYQTDWKGENSFFKYSINATSLIEVDSQGNKVAGNYFPTSFSLTQDNSNPQFTTFQYISGQIVDSTLLANVITWYPTFLDTTTLTGTPMNLVPSTFKYQSAVSPYSFASPNNHLEYTIQLELVMISDDIPLCSRVETAILPTHNGINYIKLKVNYIDYYIRIYKIALSDSAPTPLNFTTRTISQQAQKIVQEIIVYMNPWSSSFYMFETDITILFDRVSASQEPSPVCSGSTPTPTPTSTTKPSDKSCPGDPVCGGTSQGQCVNSHCQCISPWRGVQCDSKPDIIPPVIPNPETPTINSTKDEIGFHISIISLRELNFKGILEREQYLSNWTVIETKTEQKQTFYYKNKVFGNSSTNNDTIVFVTIDYFYVDTQVEFAGETSTKLAGTIKYSANVTSWPFLKKTNQLQIVFSSSAQDNTESSDSCTLKNVEYSQDQQDNVEVVYIQVNDKTFQSKFIDDAIVDGTIRQIKNVELPNVVNDSNTLSSSLIGILTPYHNEYVLIDPDFSLLISYVPPKEKEGSICSEKPKKKLSNAQIAGIVVGCFVFLVCIIAIIVYAIRFNMRKKALIRSINQKIQAVK